MSAVAVIPARGGSKRLPRKNILGFRGRPMLEWTVRSALEWGGFDKVLFTTDDAEYAQLAYAAGAECVMRPRPLAEDDISLVPVTRHALESLAFQPDQFCLLMPNCPLRMAEDIESVWLVQKQNCADAAMSIVEYGWLRPEWAMRLQGSFLEVPSEASGRAVDVATFGHGEGPYCPSGAVRWCNTESFLSQESFYMKRTAGCVLPWYRAIDIDTYSDYEMACAVACAIDNGFRFEDDSDPSAVPP